MVLMDGGGAVSSTTISVVSNAAAIDNSTIIMGLDLVIAATTSSDLDAGRSGRACQTARTVP
ncbi:hypothetical protein WK66_07090 [Burkholderia ubonensis]|nr:hypothetical protein WK66_07090 [Burkholderia ubonensis]